MFQAPPSLEAEGLTALIGQELTTGRASNVTYRVERPIGEGGSGVAFYATRLAPDGMSPVVVKVVRPSFMAGQATQARIMVQKESVALGRLNEQVPPCPFVVRFIDDGVVSVPQQGCAVEVPWLALEHVHGGVEGTTLTERVAYSVEHAGSAFDPTRAAHAIECIGKGLSAVHGVGVVHRDINPNNVLCRGFGEAENFMIADFGIARPAGIAATFGGLLIGTPGYTPVEQAGLDASEIGPWSDVFGFAASIYFLLTGEEYFEITSAVDALICSRGTDRKRLADAPALSPELRARPATCKTIDDLLARSTSEKGNDRPQSAAELARLIVPLLRADSRRSSTVGQRLHGMAQSADVRVESWSWTARHRSQHDFVVRSVSWDGSGCCLAATSGGLVFWNGTEWLSCTTDGLPAPEGIRFVRRLGVGEWLLGGDGASIASYSAEGVKGAVAGKDANVSYTHADGDFDDLAVIVGSAPGQCPVLYGMASRRWVRPLELSEMAIVTGLARVDDSRWLVVGRRNDGRAAALVYTPLMWDLVALNAPDVSAMLACDSQWEQGSLLAVGSGGAALSVSGSTISREVIPGATELSSAAVDIQGHGWAAGAGKIWRRVGRDNWRKVWEDSSWVAPIVSLFAEDGLVMAVSADGGIVEGRVLG